MEGYKQSIIFNMIVNIYLVVVTSKNSLNNNLKHLWNIYYEKSWLFYIKFLSNDNYLIYYIIVGTLYIYSPINILFVKFKNILALG